MRNTTGLRSDTRSSLCSILVLGGALALSPSYVLAETPGGACGEISNAYGPYDYIKDRDRLPIVDHAHFTSDVELLIRGKSGSLGADIDYTLRAFPNHHRALYALTRLSERLKSDQPPGMNYVVECYFDRALRFRPKDTVVRGLYANFLSSRNRKEDALKQLDAAVEFAGDNPLSHYNIGSIYFDLGAYDKAASSAQTALELGYSREDLVNRLKAKGAWPAPSQEAKGDPAPTAAAKAASAASTP